MDNNPSITIRHRAYTTAKAAKAVRCTTAQQVSFDVPEQLNQTIGYEQDEQTDLLCDSLADMSLENRHLVQELITIFPDVASGKLHDWGKALKNYQG